MRHLKETGRKKL